MCAFQQVTYPCTAIAALAHKRYDIDYQGMCDTTKYDCRVPGSRWNYGNEEHCQYRPISRYRQYSQMVKPLNAQDASDSHRNCADSTNDQNDHKMMQNAIANEVRDLYNQPNGTLESKYCYEGSNCRFQAAFEGAFFGALCYPNSLHRCLRRGALKLRTQQIFPCAQHFSA